MTKSTKIKLTPKQAKFASLYVELSDASAAYRKSYNCANMKPTTINRNAKALMDDSMIATRIERIRTVLEENRIISKEEIINDLKIISSVSIEDFIQSLDPLTEKIVLVPIEEWTHAMKRACNGIKPTAHGIELTVYGVQYAYARIAKMMGYDAPLKIETKDTTLADLLKKE